jgi:predicted nucleotidyltransferase
MHPLIEQNRQQILELCKKHHVKELYVFGSIVRDDFTDKSDIDFLVEFFQVSQDPDRYIENKDNLKVQLEQLLAKEVDLIQSAHLKNKYLRYFINQEKRLLYAQA